MPCANISINELEQAERRFVVRAFLRSVGADVALTKLAHSKRQIPYADVLRALNLSGWPNSETTDVELAWLSEPLCSSQFPRLCTYSVFGSFSTDVQLWIGNTPRKPVDGSFLLTGGVLLGTIIHIYGIKVVELGHSNPIINFAKRNWRLLPRWGFLLVFLLSYLVYAYFRRGISLDLLLPVSTSLVSFFYFRYGLRNLPRNTFLLIAALLCFFGLPYLVYDPSEYVPFGADSEYPHLAGLASSLGLGMCMWLTEMLDNLEETLDEAFRNRFRSIRRGITLLSVTTVTGYPVFLVHAYAIHQIFVENNIWFIPLVLLGVIAFSDFLHRLLER